MAERVRSEFVRYILYRVFDESDSLLYVGATTNPGLRFADHGRVQPWWDGAATIKLQHLSSAGELENAELDAIAAENPRYNVSGTCRQGLAARGPNRRKKGDGAIFQRADGMWVGSLEATPSKDGKRRQRRVYGKDRPTVERKLAEAKLTHIKRPVYDGPR